MDKIIKASQVKVGDSIRFSLKGYFFFTDPKKWREHCERIMRVTAISSCEDQEGKLEFSFDDANGTGTCSGINPDSEVILVNRPTEYIYSYGINSPDPRNIYGSIGLILADSDELAIQEIYRKRGQPPLVTIDWIYAVDHMVDLKKK